MVRPATGQPPVVLDLFGVDHIHIERRIGHHEIAPAEELVLVLVERVRLADVTLETVNREVHLGEADCGGRLLLTKKRDAVTGVLAEALDEVA